MTHVPAPPAAQSASDVPVRPPIVPFDRRSLTWQIIGDPRSMLLFAPAAFALQGMHPVIAAGVSDFSTAFTNPLPRAWRSFDAILRWVYGGDRVLDEARVLREIHKDIHGVGFDGTPYHALQADAFAWVWATGWVWAKNGIHAFWPEPVTRALEERVYEEFKNAGRILGVRERCIPPTLDEFEAYFSETLRRIAGGHEEIARVVTLVADIPAPRHLPRRLGDPVSRVASQAILFLLATGGPPELRSLLEEQAGYAWTRRRQQRSAALIRVLRVGNAVPTNVRRLPEHVLVRVARRKHFLTTEPRPLSECPQPRSARSVPPAPRCPA